MYDLKDIVSDNFTLTSEHDLLDIEDVRKMKVSFSNNKKTITLKVDLFDYLFSSDLKQILKKKIRKDLGSNIKVKFGVAL